MAATTTLLVENLPREVTSVEELASDLQVNILPSSFLLPHRGLAFLDMDKQDSRQFGKIVMHDHQLVLRWISNNTPSKVREFTLPPQPTPSQTGSAAEHGDALRPTFPALRAILPNTVRIPEAMQAFGEKFRGKIVVKEYAMTYATITMPEFEDDGAAERLTKYILDLDCGGLLYTGKNLMRVGPFSTARAKSLQQILAPFQFKLLPAHAQPSKTKMMTVHFGDRADLELALKHQEVRIARLQLKVRWSQILTLTDGF